jgi:hypothetical protein
MAGKLGQNAVWSKTSQALVFMWEIVIRHPQVGGNDRKRDGGKSSTILRGTSLLEAQD